MCFQPLVSKISSEIINDVGNLWINFQLHKKNSIHNCMNLLPLPWGYSFCREVLPLAVCLFLFRAVNSFAVTVVGHPIHYLVRNKEKKLVNFLHVKKDDYSANDRLFSLLNGCAHLTIFSMPTPCSILSFITGRLQKTWGRFEESYLRQGFEDFLTKYISTNRLFGKARGSVTSIKSRGVLNHPSRLFILVLIFCFLINCKVCCVS